MSEQRTAQSGKVVTGKIRLSYANLFAPRANSDGKGDPKYGACILVPKSDAATLKKIKAAIEFVKVDPRSLKVWGGKFNSEMKMPLRDGDIKAESEEGKNMEYAGNYFFNANNKRQPGLIDKQGMKILSQEELYSGAYAYVSVDFFAFNRDGGKGIAVSLNNVMKVADGERLGGGGAPAEEDFKDLIGTIPEEDIDNDDMLR